MTLKAIAINSAPKKYGKLYQIQLSVFFGILQICTSTRPESTFDPKLGKIDIIAKKQVELQLKLFLKHSNDFGDWMAPTSSHELVKQRLNVPFYLRLFHFLPKYDWTCHFDRLTSTFHIVIFGVTNLLYYKWWSVTPKMTMNVKLLFKNSFFGKNDDIGLWKVGHPKWQRGVLKRDGRFDPFDAIRLSTSCRTLFLRITQFNWICFGTVFITKISISVCPEASAGSSSVSRSV